MKHRDIHFQYFDSVICCKWYDSKAVLLLNSNIGGIASFSTFIRWMKVSTTKKTVPCKKKGMKGVYILLIKRQLPTDSIFWFTRLISVNSHTTYLRLGQSNLTPLYLEIANSLIGRYVNRQGTSPQEWPSKRRLLEQSGPIDIPNHLPEFQVTRKRCNYWRNEGLDNRMFSIFRTHSNIYDATFLLRLLTNYKHQPSFAKTSSIINVWLGSKYDPI